ncbi:hypothetical protein [Synechococcus sp. MIT S1220]|uniref:hypothetical protein n=1 Tax=Synechococcus sp. MIT S1220 TaxID=3082549 RepID=UPI0039AF4948
MKPLLFASLLVLSSASVALAQCRNGWCKAGCNQKGECYFFKPISKNYPYVTYWQTGPYGKFKVEGDCQQSKMRYINDDGSKDRWLPASPGTILEGTIEKLCGM